MTFTELMGLTNGNYIETAGTSAKNQCVDLANAYIRYVLGLPVIELTNAKDFPSKAGDKYNYILNTPEGIPQEGDLVIWGGTYGHIAIFIEGNTDRFTSFDENYPTGSPCHVQEHNYNNVLGWLHPNSAIIAQSNLWLTDQTKIPANLLGTTEDMEIQALRGKLGDLERTSKDNKDLKNEIERLNDKLEQANKEILKQGNKIVDLTISDAPKTADYSITELFTMLFKKLRF